MNRRSTLLGAIAAALALAPVASAHVEITPAKTLADSVVRLAIEVPTERNVPTVKLEMKIAPGVTDVSLVTKPGWKSANQGGVITWSGGKIAPGHSDRFVFEAHMPNTPGKVLLFPAVQTYATGPVVRWIGAESSDTPAPRVMLEGGPAVTTIATVTLNSDGGGHRGLVIAIAVAIVGALLSLAIVLFRKRRA